MAIGGTFQTQNKVRPGAYINFIGVPKSLSAVGERGVLAVPMMLGWGAQIVELTQQDLVSGACLAKAGVLYGDDEALPLRLALQSCPKAIIYRLNADSATAATKTLAGVTVTAAQKGAFGNKIKIEIIEGTGTWTFKTYAHGILQDTQTVTAVAGLHDNDWVKFTAEETALAAQEPIALAGGADGSEPSDISAALAALASYKFNILAVTQTGSTTKEQAALWVENLRKGQGIKVQAVLPEYAGDSEAIISTWQGYTLEDGTAITKAQAVLAIASMEAGAAITESLTGREVPGAAKVNDAPTEHDAIVDALNAGKLILSRRSDGAIVIEKDQNTLHTFTADKSYIFSKNRPARVLDQIGNDAKDLFNKSFLGKVSNDDEGREIYKNDLVAYFKKLEAMGAIQNFRADDVEVLPGNDSDSVVVALYVQPVDSMEKLYMTINVEG